ncbi:undecaprenyl-diphosphate phosphatase [Polynucleobacter kasalickyi]|uniref:Undecaprenyl-diphosphatase n=1 Tax=Polynucleobacter kasalickyi TaxID=1938817 RepID=A0A1W1Y1K8_9BURK|nr:undecaprenyl-diphosphate phosphatase [Polynucleobacter kasalickyi]SMC30100.1 Undecaprenyl-diphosphatase [Polynucleobacter kasalickyi]
MDVVLVLKALILGVVEGLTEFLPISSTGHLILAGHLLNFNDDKGKAFEVIIQLGAILAVCWEFRSKIASVIAGLGRRPLSNRFALNVIIASLPAIILALVFGKMIKAHLFAPIPVATAFIVGGLIILWAERLESVKQKNRKVILRSIENVEDLSPKDAIKVGLAQCAALIPGTSRSGATIIGGMLFGLPRQVATEFSFFLAIPVIAGATVYEIYKLRQEIGGMDWSTFGPVLAIGFVAAFISAFFCVRWLIKYVSHHDFRPFAWYRIVFGIVVLATSALGIVNWTA